MDLKIGRGTCPTNHVTVKVVVLASTADGGPGFHACEIEASPVDLEYGKHLDVAQSLAAEAGYTEPMLAFDIGDPAAEQFGAVMAWLRT